MSNSYNFDWNTALFTLVVWGMVLSPAFLALPWAWLTRIQRVRKILIRAFIMVLATPFLMAGIYVIFARLCAHGYFDQHFTECALLPDFLANGLSLAPLVLLVLPATIAAFYCAFLEIRRFMRA